MPYPPLNSVVLTPDPAAFYLSPFAASLLGVVFPLFPSLPHPCLPSAATLIFCAPDLTSPGTSSGIPYRLYRGLGAGMALLPPFLPFPAASGCFSAGQQPGDPLAPAVEREMHQILARCCRWGFCSTRRGGTCAVCRCPLCSVGRCSPERGGWRCFLPCLALPSGDCPFSLWKGQ